MVLAASIPYFYAMFSQDYTEYSKKEIEIKEIDSIALENLINYAYSGNIKIDQSNCQSIMIGASFLQLNRVKDFCAEFLIKRFHPHNVLGIRNFGDSLSHAVLVAAADKFINKKFSDVSNEEEFMQLSYPELVAIVQRDELNCTSEEVIFEAVMRWIKYNEAERSSLLPEVLSKVRLPLLSPQFLADSVATEELIKSSHQCRDLLDEAKDFHLMPERRELLSSYRTRPRGNEFIKGEIYAVGGLTKSGDAVSTVEIFDPIKNEWRMGPAMSMLRSRVGVAVLHNKLYAFGGFNGQERLSTVEVYDPDTKTWTQGKTMMCKRSAVGVASLDEFIYVCGGYDGITSLSTVEQFCPKTDSWRKVSPMMKYRSAGGVSALRGFVYALGGHDGLSIFDSVERYDPRTDSWTKVKSMTSRRCRLGVATLNGKLYACGGYDGSSFLRSVEVYDSRLDSWKPIASMNVKRSRVALTANNGKLYAIGGYDGESNLSTVEVYDTEKDTWSFVSSMLYHGGKSNLNFH